MDTRSAELLSAAIAVSMSVSLMFGTPSVMLEIMTNADVIPQWSIIATLCSLFCFFSVFIDSPRMQNAARFMSGCVWGTVLLIYLSAGQFATVFWCSVVLFIFDICSVILKGRQWTIRNHS